ncbi:MAG: hypothetical protein HY900_22425 [Deltaproteobacteria bacterium]|nr:hypothetical protein [Deltaproteobacteria bacterium]
MDRGTENGTSMDETGDPFDGWEPLTLGDYFRLLWPAKWWILVVAVACGAAALAVTSRMPNRYRATAVLKPDAPEQGRSSGILGSLAGFGVNLGGPTRVEDLEVLFRSKDLTVRVFSKYTLWAAVYPDTYDAKTGLLRPGWLDRLDRLWADAPEGPKAPGKWDAIRAAEASLTVSSDRRTGVISVSFDARAPRNAARVVEYFLEEAKSRLQEEALGRANRNKNFLAAQIDRTLDPIIRERLFALHGQEVEKEMLAKNREQFGFTLIDTPEVPDRKHSPQRLVASAVSAAMGVLLTCLWVLVRRSVTATPRRERENGRSDPSSPVPASAVEPPREATTPKREDLSGTTEEAAEAHQPAETNG